MRATRSDSLADRLDQLADVYGEVLLGLYDDVTDQRERTEAVAARAEATLAEARRMLETMGAGLPAVASPAAPPPPPQPVVDTPPITLTRPVVDDAALRAQVDERLAALRSEVQLAVKELRQHVRDLADAMAREAQQSARRAEAASATLEARVDAEAALAGTELKKQSDALAEQLRQQIADFVERQRTIEDRSAAFVAAARHAQELSTHLEQIAAAAPGAAAPAPPAIVEPAPDFGLAVRLQRTERMLYATAVVAVIAMVLALWNLVF
jgi:hypothetical protein